jgi:hypothetical protein
LLPPGEEGEETEERQGEKHGMRAQVVKDLSSVRQEWLGFGDEGHHGILAENEDETLCECVLDSG